MPDDFEDSNRLNKSINEAGAAVAKMEKIHSESRSMTERFYYQLALFSSGAIVLSMTFLGYLISSRNQICSFYTLLIAWLLLAISLIASLLQNKYYALYLYVTGLVQFGKGQLQLEETQLEVFSKNPGLAINLNTKERVDKFVKDKNYNIAAYRRGTNKHEKREETYSEVYIWLGRISTWTFVIGIIFLLVFATINVWSN